jgi:hypothetical protein
MVWKLTSELNETRFRWHTAQVSPYPRVHANIQPPAQANEHQFVRGARLLLEPNDRHHILSTYHFIQSSVIEL